MNKTDLDRIRNGNDTDNETKSCIIIIFTCIFE